jgi:GT2 family glycosyltransferase
MHSGTRESAASLGSMAQTRRTVRRTSRESAHVPAPVSDDSITFAVCVCTRDRHEPLQRCLESLVSAERPPNQIIVSDDSKNDPAVEVLGDRFRDVVWTRGPQRGLGPNRNAVMSYATCDYVLFLDDDALMAPQFLERMHAHLTRLREAGHPDAIVTGPELRDGIEISAADVSFFGFQHKRYRPGSSRKTVVINSTVWPRSLLDRIAFDERISYGCDEVDISMRAVALGHRIEMVHDACNVHLRDDSARSDYAAQAEMSRMLVTTKRYFCVERRFGHGIAYLVLGPAHQIVSAGRRDGVAGVVSGMRVVRGWMGHLGSVLRRPRVSDQSTSR